MRVQGLAQYADVLVDKNGYNDLGVLRRLDRPRQKKVASLCSMLPGHAAKFVDALSQTPESKQSTPPLPPTKKKKGKKPERSETDASYVAMIVDRSGSMRSMGAEVMNGFNTFLKEQKTQPGECHATIVRFDTEIETLQHGVPIADVPLADGTTFQPRGCTALVDAMGQTIEKVEAQVKSMATRPSRIMVMILTDGADNESTRFERKDVMETIKRLEGTGNWEFIFVGANQDAISVGARYGMRSKNCLSFDADRSHGRETFTALAENATQYRQCASKSMYGGFSKMQRSKCKKGFW